jgi:hypothetical protein
MPNPATARSNNTPSSSSNRFWQNEFNYWLHSSLGLFSSRGAMYPEPHFCVLAGVLLQQKALFISRVKDALATNVVRRVPELCARWIFLQKVTSSSYRAKTAYTQFSIFLSMTPPPPLPYPKREINMWYSKLRNPPH